MRVLRSRRLLLAVALVATGAGLSVALAREDGRAPGAPVVLAASSLREVLPPLAPGARLSFGGTGALRLQIERGAPADLFAAASPVEPTALHAAGRCEQPVVFAGNRLVLVVPADAEDPVGGLADLARGGRRLAIGGTGVPVGRYARELLERTGRTDVLRAATVSEERDAASITAKVAFGSADAGIVYATDWAAARDRLRRIELPAAARPEVRYALCVVRRPGAARAAARAIADRLTGPEGRRRLRAAGFTLP